MCISYLLVKQAIECVMICRERERETERGGGEGERERTEGEGEREKGGGGGERELGRESCKAGLGKIEVCLSTCISRI